MRTFKVAIRPDTPELASLCDAIRRSEGNSILETALSQYLSRLVVSTMANREFLASLRDASEADDAKLQRINELREELAKLEAK